MFQALSNASTFDCAALPMLSSAAMDAASTQLKVSAWTIRHIGHVLEVLYRQIDASALVSCCWEFCVLPRYDEERKFVLREDHPMARISLIAPESASPEVQEIYEKTLRGKPGNAQKALAHRPELLKNFLPFYASVGKSLDRKLYEEIYLRVSFINGCHYCEQHHVASSKRVGLTAEDWQTLKDGNYRRFTEKAQ